MFYVLSLFEYYYKVPEHLQKFEARNNVSDYSLRKPCYYKKKRLVLVL